MRCTLFALAALCFAPPVSAQDAPSMVGTWTGTSEGVGIRDGWSGGDITYVITEQRGSAFKGHDVHNRGTASESRGEFVGGVALDGRTIRTADEDGITTGLLVDPNTLEQCYYKAGEDAEVSCYRLVRQPE